MRRAVRPRFYYGWVIVAVIALAGFTQTAQTFPVWGVLLKPITEDLSWSRTVFSGAMGVGTILGAVAALAAAPAIDRYGARWPMVGAFALIGLTLVLMAGMSALWQFYVLLVVGRTVHLGIVSIAQESTIPKWFIARRGTAVGIGASGNRVGSAVTPLYTYAIIALSGWRLSLVMIGVVVWLISMIPVALFLRPPPDSSGSQHGTTAEPARAEQTRERSLPETPSLEEASFSRSQVLRLPSFYLLMLASTVAFVVVPTTSLHFVPFLTDQGISPGVSVGVVALSSAVGIPGSLLVGMISDRIGSKWTSVASFAMFSGLFAGVWLVQSGPTAFVWGVGYGLALTGVMTGTQILMADYFGHRYLAGVRSLIMPVRSLGQALGPVLAGLAYDTSGSYSLVFVGFVLLNLFGAGMILISRKPIPSLADGSVPVSTQRAPTERPVDETGTSKP